MNTLNIGSILLNMVLPAIWVSVGPVVTTAITATVNTVMKTYVPRSLQLVLSSVIGAVVAGVSGAMEGIDPTIAAEIGGASGLGVQAALMMNGNRFLSGPPPQADSTKTS